MLHKYLLNGYYIALDVNSGAVFSLDECSYTILDLIEPPLNAVCPEYVIQGLKSKFSQIEITESYDELFNLYLEGVLFSVDTYKELASKLGPAPIKSMCLNIAHDCNLRCGYCFASQGNFGHGKKLMSFDIGKAAIDFLIKHSAGRKNLEVDFFGGEPLLNFDSVKRIVAYARNIEKLHNKNFRFTITTNGLLLNGDVIDFINREMSNIVLSIDGRKEIHDAFRFDCGGKGSYDSILPKYKELIKSRTGKEYYVRGTYTRFNLDFSKDVEHLYQLGFDQISVEPVVTASSEPYSITEYELPSIFSEYETLAKSIIELKSRGQHINFFHFMLDLDQGPCALRRLRGCSCGNEYIAVTPEGDIYPCHQFVGLDEWKMGNVLVDGVNNGIKEYFAKATIYSKESCGNCWARFYCSGGCNANNYLYEGDTLNPHKVSCEIEKKRLECAIMIKVALGN